MKCISVLAELVKIEAMNNDVVAVKFRNVLAMDQGHAVFLGNDEKTIVIFVDDSVGKAIGMSMRGRVQERPLTHDLMGHMLLAFGANVERVVINDLDNGIYFARIIMSVENELQQRKMVELDARPSDSIALAVAQNAPLFVAQHVWDDVEDVADALEDIQSNETEEEEE